MNKEYGLNRYKLLYIKLIGKKDNIIAQGIKKGNGHFS